MQQHGFSLLELSIVIVIIGLLSAMGVEASTYYAQRTQFENTQSRMAILKDALLRYTAEQGHFPCPARPVDTLGIATYGRASDCSIAPAAGSGITLTGGVRIGAIPFRELNLPSDYGHDSWNQKFIYAVTNSLAIVSSFAASEGAISVYDGYGNSVSTPPDQVAFIILSTGRNRAGSYSEQGILGTACHTTTVESENCDNDTRFNEAAFNNGENASNFYYDDMLVWGTKSSATVTGNGGYLNYTYKGITTGTYSGNQLMKADQECKSKFGNNARVLRHSMLSMISTPSIGQDAWIFCDKPLGSPGCTEGGQYTNGLLVYGTYIDTSGAINSLKATLGNFRAACADHEWIRS